MKKKEKRILRSCTQELKEIKTELRLLRKELIPLIPHPSLDTTASQTAIEPIAESDNKIESNAEQAELAVYDWLTAQNIAVKNYRERNAGDTIFDQLALFLGERFANLSRLHELIRRSLSSGATFNYNLSSRSQSEIADCTQFCHMLSSYAFLSFYKYNKMTKTIYAAPQRVGKVINFFTGGWFERYVYLKIVDLLEADQLTFTCLVNPQITFADGDDFELDLLFLVENQPLWIECKTGEYAAYIPKYSEAQKLLSVPSERSVLVILDIPDNLTDNLTHLYDIVVANKRNFVEKVHEVLGVSGDLQAVAVPQVQTQPATKPPILHHPPASIATLLNKVGLRPVPEHRMQVLQKLVEVVATFEQPMTMAETKTILAECVQSSKSQLQDILNAVIRSNCVRDSAGKVQPSFVQPFAELLPADPVLLDQKCVESYARAILWNNPAYFDSAANITEFEQVVGGKVPGPATIQSLRNSR